MQPRRVEERERKPSCTYWFNKLIICPYIYLRITLYIISYHTRTFLQLYLMGTLAAAATSFRFWPTTAFTTLFCGWNVIFTVGGALCAYVWARGVGLVVEQFVAQRGLVRCVWSNPEQTSQHHDRAD